MFEHNLSQVLGLQRASEPSVLFVASSIYKINKYN